MKIPSTYKEFLNLTFDEYKAICTTKQSKEVVTMMYAFYKKAKEEGKNNNSILNENNDNESLRLSDLFGVELK